MLEAPWVYELFTGGNRPLSTPVPQAQAAFFLYSFFLCKSRPGSLEAFYLCSCNDINRGATWAKCILASGNYIAIIY